MDDDDDVDDGDASCNPLLDCMESVLDQPRSVTAAAVVASADHLHRRWLWCWCM